jgi:hypothetical protein
MLEARPLRTPPKALTRANADVAPGAASCTLFGSHELRDQRGAYNRHKARRTHSILFVVAVIDVATVSDAYAQGRGSSLILTGPAPTRNMRAKVVAWHGRLLLISSPLLVLLVSTTSIKTN